MLLESLVTFGFYQLWSKPCLEVADLAVKVAHTSSLNSKHHLAEWDKFCIAWPSTTQRAFRVEYLDLDGQANDARGFALRGSRTTTDYASSKAF